MTRIGTTSTCVWLSIASFPVVLGDLHDIIRSAGKIPEFSRIQTSWVRPSPQEHKLYRPSWLGGLNDIVRPANIEYVRLRVLKSNNMGVANPI